MQHTNPNWTIFSYHGMVLFHVAANPDVTLRELSHRLGITERHVFRIVKDLAAADMLLIQRRGRRNVYVVNPEAHLRHPTLAHIPLRCIIQAVVPALEGSAAAPAERSAGVNPSADEPAP